MTGLKACPLLLLTFSLVSVGKAECPFPSLSGTVTLTLESTLKNNFPDNSEAIVECVKGYERDEGPTSIICVNGVWSPPKLICKKMDCGPPSPSPHMTYIITDGTLFGALIQPRCETGYDLEGSSYRQCLVSGWRGKAECILTECIVPDRFEHGSMDAPQNLLFNDVITFSCDDGYTLVGNSSIKCVEYGEFDLLPPICKAVECPVLHVPFANLTEGNPPFFYKSEARFECWPGYRMNDSATTVCETSGWSPIPVCEVNITQKEESTTTNKPTTTDPTPSTHSLVIITQTEESTTTNKPTTTDPTPSTHSLGGLTIVPTTVLSLLCLLGVPVMIVGAGVVLGFLGFRYSKRKGSYNTGEELRGKEELLLNQSV